MGCYAELNLDLGASWRGVPVASALLSAAVVVVVALPIVPVVVAPPAV